MYHDEEPIQMHCRHIHANGRRCGSPSLRNENFCYYHHKARRCGPRQPQVKTLTDRKASTFDLPSPADLSERTGIQLAIGQILHKIAHNEIDPRRAGLLLYGLQIASMNLPREPRADHKGSRREIPPPPAEELVDDEIHGPLAPETEWEEYQGPKGSAQLMVEEFKRRYGPDWSKSDTRESAPPISLSAVAANSPATHTPTPRCSGVLSRVLDLTVRPAPLARVLTPRASRQPRRERTKARQFVSPGLNAAFPRL